MYNCNINPSLEPFSSPIHTQAMQPANQTPDNTPAILNNIGNAVVDTNSGAELKLSDNQTSHS
ncbi:hypothetical protein DPMN_074618 [Dreissena polymorpha]|uniref:Uncharacterized protein n=1 Tax=Dreissena polymorpha TaxID=45954 RepID=A0A9D3YK68_DREPO|nr:hypothetical protein DPMN_074618 [Dreissena polymorpha]